MIRRRIASFGYAFEGLAAMLRTQPNAWIHTVATVLVVTAAQPRPSPDWSPRYPLRPPAPVPVR